MNARSILLGSLLALAVVADAGMPAQRAERGVQRTYTASPVDTRSFFPQIAPTWGQRPFTIAHESPITVTMGRPNNLRAGQVMSEERTLPGFAFPGIGPAGWTPADPDISVGTNHIVQVINAQIAFFTKGGTKQFQTSAQTFFTGMGAFSFQFDPKTFYDRVHGRFVLVYLERDTSAGNVSKILVAVSDDGDPNGTWFRYRVEALMNIGGNDYWMDYPGFGYNKDAYVVSGNLFRFSGSGFGGVEFIVMPSANMLTGGALTATNLRDGSGASCQMAEIAGGNVNYAFGVSRRNTTTVRVYAIKDILTLPAFVFADVAVPFNNGPAGPAESTSGQFLDTIDARVFNAAWRNGRLVTAHNFEGTNFVGSRWYELDTADWPNSGTVTLVQSGEVQSTTLNRFDPAINKNATGKISMVFTTSSTSVTADMTVTSRKPGDPLGTMGAPTLLETSAGNNYGSGRWGDYFSVDTDPTDDVTFWGVAMTVAAGNNWNTFIRNWTVPAAVVQTSDAFSIFRGTLLSGSLASLTSDDNNYLDVRKGIVLNAGEAPIQVILETTAPSSVIYDIDLSMIAKVNTPGLTQRIEAWNFTTGQWVQVGQQGATTGESAQNVTTVGNVLDFVEPGSRKIRFKASWFQTGIVINNAWAASIDQVQWTVTSA